jgi:dihydrofolate reductase
MRKLVVTEYLSLDGVMEAPEEWAFQYHSEDMVALTHQAMRESDALLLGRVTYEIFAAFWPTSNDEPYASHMRNAAKYVVSTTLAEAPWGSDDSATVINGNLADEINELKRRPGKTIGVVGSGDLVRSLAKENLVDEYHLFVHPLILGSGKRLFDEGANTPLRLVESRSFSGGIVLLKYQPIR